MDPIIVLIAEARTRFRDRLCRFLSGQAGIQVGGEAADGRQALSGAEALQPDILLLDMQLIQIGGFEGIAHIRARSPTETATHERHSAAMAGKRCYPKNLRKILQMAGCTRALGASYIGLISKTNYILQ